MRTRIFLDSGNPTDTRIVKRALGFLDGQTTNPSLIAKNPRVQARMQKEGSITPAALFGEYERIAKEISQRIKKGSISLEVYADARTTYKEMLWQARLMNTWISNAHIKFPATKEGLKAAHYAVKEGLRVNMTLVFTQEQARAVYSATRGAKKGQVFVSPFIGRLDDTGVSGMDVVRNIQRAYAKGDGHVSILGASIRHKEHVHACIEVGVDCITAPKQVLIAWHKKQPKKIVYDKNLKPVAYKKQTTSKDWKTMTVSHPLIAKGLNTFAKDWQNLVGGVL
ncbi:transaldolase [archaeon CG10_big_fil_rev_8_21_14_0_10_43_11]|nr:MAG: transaldolase [archaeon CG10_big_fil_rev_8_21_14_0_10_43_11]